MKQAAEFRQLAFSARACGAVTRDALARLQSGRLATVMLAIPRPVGVGASCGLAALLGGVSRRKQILQLGRERFASQS